MNVSVTLESPFIKFFKSYWFNFMYSLYLYILYEILISTGEIYIEVRTSQLPLSLRRLLHFRDQRFSYENQTDYERSMNFAHVSSYASFWLTRQLSTLFCDWCNIRRHSLCKAEMYLDSLFQYWRCCAGLPYKNKNVWKMIIISISVLKK